MNCNVLKGKRRRREILVLLGARGPMSTKNLVGALGISMTQTHRHVVRLKSERLIEGVNNDENGWRFRLTRAGREHLDATRHPSEAA